MFAEAMQGFLDGKVDAILGFPPQPQEVRAKQIGQVIVNTTQDRPWSHYFCCMAVLQREFVRKNPSRRSGALRAILKAADICALSRNGLLDTWSRRALSLATRSALR